MAIELHGECALVIKRQVGLNFQGGMPAFRARYDPRSLEDQHLIALCASSSSGLQAIVDDLAENGLTVGQDFGVAGVWAGVYDSCPGINFYTRRCRDGGVRWRAESVDAAHPGKVTVCKPYPGETCFGGGSGVLIPMRPPPAAPEEAERTVNYTGDRT